MNLEAHLLATMLAYPECIVDMAPILRGEDFDRPAHQVLFSGMIALAQKKPNFDALMLKTELEAAGTLQAAGGVELIMDLTAIMPASSLIATEHAKAIAEAAVRRRVTLGLKKAAEASQDPKTALPELAGIVESIAMEAASARTEKEPRRAGEYVRQFFQYLEARARGEITGLRLGFKDVDDLTGGIQKTDFVIVGGRPGMGKTSFALQGMTNVCAAGGVGAFFELEMMAWQVVSRSIYQRARVNSKFIKIGKLAQRDYPKLTIAAESLQNLNLYLDDSVGLTPLQLLGKCRRIKQRHGRLDFIVVDNCQIMKGDGRYNGDRRRELEDVSNNLKRICKELECPIMGISHLNRESAKGADPEPSLHDLRDTGAWEQDADIVMLLHNESHYKEVPEADQNKMKVIFAKFREGETGFVTMQFTPEFTTFDDLSPREEPPQQYRNEGLAF